MNKFTDLLNARTATDVIVMQANLAKSALAYVPNEDFRAKLASAIEINAAFATAFWDSIYAYNDALKSKVLAV